MTRPPASSQLPAPARGRSVAMVGDVLDETGFGGSPFHFFRTCQRLGFAVHAWRVDLGKVRLPRLVWNAAQRLRGQRHGGFQYSERFRALLLRQIPAELLATEILSFHQNFPPCAPVERAGGEVNFYLDATYTQLFPAYEMDRKASPGILRHAILQERDAFRRCRRVIASQSWAYRSLVEDYGVPEEKMAMILPAANLDLPEDFSFGPPPGRPGVDRPVVLGFIGVDWRRKGLEFLLEVRTGLAARGWKARVRTMGCDGRAAPGGEGVEHLGFIDKKLHFLPFVRTLDIGCLFSKAEAAGIAVFEFLRCGVPAAGFTVNGLHDLLPPDAGFRFAPGAPVAEVVDAFDAYLRDEARQDEFRRNACRWSPLVTWERCVAEMQEFWETGTVRQPLRPWKGLGVERGRE